MTIGEATAWLANGLDNIYENTEAAQIAILVVEHVTGLSRTERILNNSAPLHGQQLTFLQVILQRLQLHEPVQYVLETAWFYNLKLFVDKAVLIPRPETEELVDWIVKDAATAHPGVHEKKEPGADLTKELKILDVGTGSGCIALALKKALPRAEVWGCDTSDAALNVARRNASDLNIRVDFLGIDFLNPAQRTQLPRLHIIVSNPPYIPLLEKKNMQPNVVQHEPHGALFVPNEDPLIFYKALASFGLQNLHHHGALYMEIHEAAGREVTDLFRKEGFETVLRRDMQGKERMIKAMLT